MMITHTVIISNNAVSVCYHSDPETVSVLHKSDASKQKLFAGYPLRELFDEFMAAFNDNISFKDACKHFTPNITSIKF